MLTKSLLTAAIAGLAAAAPTRRQEVKPFSLIAVHSTSAVHLRGIAFNGERWWIGKDTATYCPGTEANIDCSKYSNTTSSVVATPQANSTSVSLNDGVPGGQLVYVTPAGEVGYTIAHSGAIPEGAVYVPFEYSPAPEADRVGALKFNSSDFWACPSSDAEDVYQIFATTPDFTDAGRTDCIDVLLGTADYTGSPAWEYT